MAAAGYSCQLVIGTGANAQIVGYARDVKLDGAAGAVEASSRAVAGWKEFLAGIREWSVSIEQLWVPTDAALLALRDAYLSGAGIAVRIEDSGLADIPTWQASTGYTLGSYVKPTAPRGFRYECTQAGTSGASEPSWPTTVGQTVSDGTAKWTCRYAGKGFYGSAVVSAMEHGQPLEGGATLACTLKGTGPLVVIT
ncbi:MAG: phage tail protein [Planctomycetota bacterium]|nr:phage tail protein [Planctomycetota bacterium]